MKFFKTNWLEAIIGILIIIIGAVLFMQDMGR